MCYDYLFWWTLIDCPKCLWNKMIPNLIWKETKALLSAIYPSQTECLPPHVYTMKEYIITCITSNYLKLDSLDSISLQSSSWSPSKNSIESLWRQYSFSGPSSRLSVIHFKHAEKLFVTFEAIWTWISYCSREIGNSIDWVFGKWTQCWGSSLGVSHVHNFVLGYETRSMVSLSLVNQTMIYLSPLRGLTIIPYSTNSNTAL